MGLYAKYKEKPPVVLARKEFWRVRSKRVYDSKSAYDFICQQYESRLGRKPDLAVPMLFTEKLQWLKLFWRDDTVVRCSDKYLVRGYLEELGYGDLLNQQIAAYTSVDDIDIAKLPQRFVLKGSHGSGWNLIVKDKDQVNWFWWKKIMRSWLKTDAAWFGYEWNYSNGQPRIIVDKYLEDETGSLSDFKIICIAGEPRVMKTDVDRFTNHQRVYADCTTGETLDLHDGLFDNDGTLQMRFGDAQRKMVSLARELCKPFPEVRVDFYEAGGKVYFGEFTFFDNCGYCKYSPAQWERTLGDLLVLPEPNYNLELCLRLLEERLQELENA